MTCVCCGTPLVKQPHESDRLFRRRQLCSRECRRRLHEQAVREGREAWRESMAERAAEMAARKRRLFAELRAGR